MTDKGKGLEQQPSTAEPISQVDNLLDKITEENGTSKQLNFLYRVLDYIVRPENTVALLRDSTGMDDDVIREVAAVEAERRTDMFVSSRLSACIRLSTTFYAQLAEQPLETFKAGPESKIAIDTAMHFAYRSLLSLVRASLTARDLDPTMNTEITEEDSKRLYGICESIWAFYQENPDIAADDVVGIYLDAQGAPSTEEAMSELHELVASSVIQRPITRVSTNLPKIALNGKPQKVRVDKDGKVVVIASVADQQGNGVVLDQLDVAISNAVGQLMWENRTPDGNVYLQATPSQIWRKYVGMDADEPVSKEIQAKVAAILDKGMLLPTTVDFSQQVELFSRTRLNQDVEVEQYKFTRPLIPCGRIDRKFRYKGQVVNETVYEFYALPPVYQYSLAVRQIATFPKDLISPPRLNKGQPGYVANPMPRSAENMPIADVLLRQINFMAHDKNKRQTYFSLSYESIVEQSGADVSTRDKMRTVRDNVKRALKQFCARGGLAYAEEYKVGRTWAGVKLWKERPSRPLDPTAWNTLDDKT